MSQYETFVQLHNADSPVLIGNSWDVMSAKILQENGFKAIATSSLAVALSMGYEDGENLPFELLFQTAKRIKKNIDLPFSVDMEKGYSDNIAGILQNLEQLYDIGVVGFNIEDSSRSDENVLRPADEFAKLVEAIAGHLAKKNMRMYMNARTDAFLIKHPSALTETQQRIKLYTTAGASGIFVPFVKEETDISAVVAVTSLPVNVLSMPGLPGIDKLAELGVRRLSLGSSLFRWVNRAIAGRAQAILQERSVQGLF